jgi:hypothetical protein
MVAIDYAALDMSTQAYGIPGSAAERSNVMNPGDEKFTGIVGMSQWITANTCLAHGVGSKEYELVEPELTEDEASIANKAFSQGRPSGWYLNKVMEKANSWNPPGGFKYVDRPRITIEELSKK